jgi:hypothetical protein
MELVGDYESSSKAGKEEDVVSPLFFTREHLSEGFF